MLDLLAKRVGLPVGSTIVVDRGMAFAGSIAELQRRQVALCRGRWPESSGFGGFDCSCSRTSFQGNRQYHAHSAARFLCKPKWASVKTKARSRTFKPYWHMLLWPNSRAALRESSVLDINCSRRSQFPPDVLHHQETRDPHVQHMLATSTRSGFRRGCGRASCAHPQTLLTRSTFPVRYPVLAPEGAPRWQTHAQRRNLRISVSVDQVHVSGALSGACTGKGPQMANPRPTPKPENFGQR